MSILETACSCFRKKKRYKLTVCNLLGLKQHTDKVSKLLVNIVEGSAAKEKYMVWGVFVVVVFYILVEIRPELEGH